MKNFKKYLYIVLIVLSLANVMMPVIQNWSYISEKFDEKSYEYKYNQSQYVIPLSKHPISDRDLYIHASYKYATGLNPILINSDHPPFAKYIIGLSILAFHNFNYIALIIGIAIMLLLYMTIFKITQSHLLAAGGIFMLSLDSMFKDQILTGPYLDIYQGFFLIAYFYVFILWEKKKSIFKLIFLGFILGCFAATKFYFPALILLAVTGLFFLLTRHTLLKSIQYIIFISLTALITYTATYSMYFLHGNSLHAFLGAQKWIFLYWQNNSVRRATIVANVIPFIFFNHWHIWWGDKGIIYYRNWSIFWPIFLLTGVLSIGVVFQTILSSFKKIDFRNKMSDSLSIALFLSSWIITIFVYLCIIPISPRYLMLLYFPIYILTPLVVKLKFNHYV